MDSQYTTRKTFILNTSHPPSSKKLEIKQDSGDYFPPKNNTTHDRGLTNATRHEQSYVTQDAPIAQAKNVYDLTSIYQVVKWMHAVCGYPVKST